MVTTASTNTSVKRLDYRPASTTTGDFVNWVPSAPSDTFAENSACSTLPAFVLKAKAARMRTLDGRRISHGRRCGLRRQRRSWSVSVLLSEKSRSVRRSVSASGGMNVAGVVVSCEDGIAVEEGDRLPTKGATFLRSCIFTAGVFGEHFLFLDLFTGGHSGMPSRYPFKIHIAAYSIRL